MKLVMVFLELIEIEANPDLSTISFTHNDVDRWSNDWDSIALKNEFGTNAAEMVMFINVLATKSSKLVRCCTSWPRSNGFNVCLSTNRTSTSQS